MERTHCIYTCRVKNFFFISKGKVCIWETKLSEVKKLNSWCIYLKLPISPFAPSKHDPTLQIIGSSSAMLLAIAHVAMSQNITQWRATWRNSSNQRHHYFGLFAYVARICWTVRSFEVQKQKSEERKHHSRYRCLKTRSLTPWRLTNLFVYILFPSPEICFLVYDSYIQSR